MEATAQRTSRRSDTSISVRALDGVCPVSLASDPRFATGARGGRHGDVRKATHRGHAEAGPAVRGGGAVLHRVPGTALHLQPRPQLLRPHHHETLARPGHPPPLLTAQVPAAGAMPCGTPHPGAGPCVPRTHAARASASAAET